MLMVQDCRRKAAECLRSAEAATDRKTRADFCRTARAWMTLAGHVEQHPLTVAAPPPIRPADLASRLGSAHRESVLAGDVLRKRLHLTDVSDDDFPDPTQRG